MSCRPRCSGDAVAFVWVLLTLTALVVLTANVRHVDAYVAPRPNALERILLKLGRGKRLREELVRRSLTASKNRIGNKSSAVSTPRYDHTRRVRGVVERTVGHTRPTRRSLHGVFSPHTPTPRLCFTMSQPVVGEIPIDGSGPTGKRRELLTEKNAMMDLTKAKRFPAPPSVSPCAATKFVEDDLSEVCGQFTYAELRREAHTVLTFFVRLRKVAWSASRHQNDRQQHPSPAQPRFLVNDALKIEKLVVTRTFSEWQKQLQAKTT